jgi:hypothetical protein
MGLTFSRAVSMASRWRSWGHHLALFSGYFTGACITALVLREAIQFGIRHNIEAAVLALAGLLVLPGILKDAGIRVLTPYVERQVPEWLRELVPLSVTAYVFGSLLGLGFATRYTYSAHAATFVAIALLPTPELMLACLLFALFKSAVLFAAPRCASREDRSDAFDRRFFFRRNGAAALRLANVAVAMTVFAVFTQSLF